MSNAIWDALASFDERNQRGRELARLNSDIAEVGTRCGDCYKWMKSRQCPREHNVNGYTRGPSGDAPICGKFVEKESATSRRAELMQERARMDSATNGERG